MAKKKPTKAVAPIEFIEWGAITYESHWVPNRGLGPTDGIYGVDKIWPIYCLDIANPLCLYHRFQEQLMRVQKKTDKIDTRDMAMFLHQNPHIYMELLVFEDLLKESMYFKLRGKIYCYCVETMKPLITEFGQKIGVRFLFDPFKVLGLPYNIEG